MKSLNILCALLIIAGAVNWGLVGLFQVDPVASLFGGRVAIVSRIVYALVGLAGVYGLLRLFSQPRSQPRQEAAL